MYQFNHVMYIPGRPFFHEVGSISNYFNVNICVQKIVSFRVKYSSVSLLLMK